MTPVPDESARCRCGSGTYAVSGEGPRTCARCGYLVSYCRCGETGWTAGARLRIPPMSDRVRAALGAGVLTAFGALFVMMMLTSPFVAVLGLGIPLGLCASFFGEWLRDDGPPQVAREPLTVETELLRKQGNSR